MNAHFFADFLSGRTFKRASLALATGALAFLVQAAEPEVKGKTYTVKPGDTLDKIVRTQMADSPLRAELLKEALQVMTGLYWDLGTSDTPHHVSAA